MKSTTETTQRFQGNYECLDDGKTGKWSLEENLKYAIFLEYKGNMGSSKKKRNLELFTQMSNFIQTRNPIQCRTHHQKLSQRYANNLRKIILSIKDQIGRNQYNTKYDALTSKYESKLGEEDIEDEKVGEVEIQTEISCFNSRYPNQPYITPSIQAINAFYYTLYNNYQ